ncbi:GNAT family N-acetyltransferase [Candidatus Woesebacteria bacterium]|nr:GNAT family N-acetyltransferase [Candidatus Woesebacteria bacterium]
MIRKAEQKDLEKLKILYDKVTVDRSQLGDSMYEANIQKQGFLLGTDDPYSLNEELENAYEFLVAEHDGDVVGYLVADHRPEQKFIDDEYKTWFDNNLKDFYYNSDEGMSLSTIATDPQSMHKGVATELLRCLEEKLKLNNFKYLFSIVIVSPLTNTPSIVWHTKQGFKRLAMSRPRQLFGWDNHVSILFVKEL